MDVLLRETRDFWKKTKFFQYTVQNRVKEFGGSIQSHHLYKKAVTDTSDHSFQTADKPHVSQET